MVMPPTPPPVRLSSYQGAGRLNAAAQACGLSASPAAVCWPASMGPPLTESWQRHSPRPHNVISGCDLIAWDIASTNGFTGYETALDRSMVQRVARGST